MLLTPAVFDQRSDAEQRQSALARRIVEGRPKLRLRERLRKSLSKRRPNTTLRQSRSTRTLAKPAAKAKSDTDSVSSTGTSGSTAAVTEYVVPTPPQCSPRASTASARVKQCIELDRTIINLRNGFRFGDEQAEERANNLTGLPKAVKKKIWEMVLVKSGKVTICGCCNCKNIGATHLSLTQVSRAVRLETLPIFYRDNRFVMPVGHDTTKGAHHWLSAMSYRSRNMIRHLEIPTVDVQVAIKSMLDMCRMQLATDLAIRQTIALSPGYKCEIYWVTFRALLPGLDDTSIDSALYESVSSSILDLTDDEGGGEDEDNFDLGGSVGLRSQSSKESFETVKSHSSSAQAPPVLMLTRPSGEEVDPPRWSFVDNFNDHFAKRLAAVDHEPRAPARPLQLAKRREVVAPPRRTQYDYDTDPTYENTELQIVLDKLREARFSSGSWVLGR